MLLALAAAATAAWALAESLHATDGKATEFWGIVTDARGRVRPALLLPGVPTPRRRCAGAMCVCV